MLDFDHKTISTDGHDFMVTLRRFYSEIKDLLDQAQNIDCEDFITASSTLVYISNGWSISDGAMRRITSGTIAIGDSIYTSAGYYSNNELEELITCFLRLNHIPTTYNTIYSDELIALVGQHRIGMAVDRLNVIVYAPRKGQGMVKCDSIKFDMHDPKSLPAMLELLNGYWSI